MGDSALTVRRTTRDDLDDIVALGSRSLGWAGDERDRAFFRWKHWENPFGESPGWAAFDGDRMVAFRTFLRWEVERAGEKLRLVRAVDTATDPEYQGRGLFRRLTMQAVDELTADGVDAVFNTPNDQSRPGYLKMGWEIIGRPTLMVRPRSIAVAARLPRNRVAAEKWSIETDVGDPIQASHLPASPIDRVRWTTPTSRDYLSWRYGFEPLAYRVVGVRSGVAIVRFRERGSLREVCICEWLSDRPDRKTVGEIVAAGADYAVAVGLSTSHGFVPLHRQGPIVTWRPLANPTVPDLADTGWVLGDLELF